MPSDAIPHLPVNHVFVDFENVKKVEVGVLERKNVVLHLFLGPQNKKLDLQQLVSRATRFCGANEGADVIMSRR